MKVRCPYCGNRWNYHGFDKNYATCPKCKKNVRLHPYLRKGYKPLSGLKFPNKNYIWGSDEMVIFI